MYEAHGRALQHDDRMSSRSLSVVILISMYDYLRYQT
jgi:hypothetical protein